MSWLFWAAMTAPAGYGVAAWLDASRPAGLYRAATVVAVLAAAVTMALAGRAKAPWRGAVRGVLVALLAAAGFAAAAMERAAISPAVVLAPQIVAPAVAGAILPLAGPAGAAVVLGGAREFALLLAVAGRVTPGEVWALTQKLAVATVMFCGVIGGVFALLAARRAARRQKLG
jgi:hypothetical protein